MMYLRFCRGRSRSVAGICSRTACRNREGWLTMHHKQARHMLCYSHMYRHASESQQVFVICLSGAQETSFDQKAVMEFIPRAQSIDTHHYLGILSQTSSHQLTMIKRLSCHRLVSRS
ncbi:hypothetical protein IG631_05650 [Alternaria alternata]|nr:hypothetical protein IG631_05650 [Alternaria alternata]